MAASALAVIIGFISGYAFRLALGKIGKLARQGSTWNRQFEAACSAMEGELRRGMSVRIVSYKRTTVSPALLEHPVVEIEKRLNG